MVRRKRGSATPPQTPGVYARILTDEEKRSLAGQAFRQTRLDGVDFSGLTKLQHTYIEQRGGSSLRVVGEDVRPGNGAGGKAPEADSSSG